jgi:hypothetical protein
MTRPPGYRSSPRLSPPRHGGGFYWLAPAALLGMVGAVYNAWVLLVEIVR